MSQEGSRGGECRAAPAVVGGSCSRAGGGDAHGRPALSVPSGHPPGVRRGSGTVCSREYAVTFANVAVGVRAVGILYSQTMICGMKTGVFQLKIKMSA